MTDVFDLIVIGGGSGGIATANRAASYGARVMLIEAADLGGTCVNVGCVPKKLMWYAAERRQLIASAKDFAFNASINGFDWGRLKQKRDAFIHRLNGLYEENLNKNKVRLIHGKASFVNQTTVAVGDQQFTAAHILIATGSAPRVPDVDGAEHGITSDGFFELADQPERVAVIGGGYIGVELAGVFAALGTSVELLVRSQLLKEYDHDITEALAGHLKAQGIRLELGCSINRVELDSNHEQILIDQQGNPHGPFDCVLWATGRQPNTAELGLRSVGVNQDEQGYVVTDEWQDTNIKGIHAVGDVTGRAALTPVAIAAGRRLADRLFGGMSERKLDYDLIPTVVFSHPPLATVGLSEAQARENFGNQVKVYQSRFTPMSQALSDQPVEKTLIKLVVCGENEKVVGCHLIGEGADEILQGFAVAMRMGACKRDFDDTIAIHPTSAEELVTLR